MSKKLAKRGARLILVDINEKWNNETKEEILADKEVAYAYRCDVSDHEQVKNLAQQIKNEIGEDVTMLINNAGVLVGKELLKLSDEEIERLFRINVYSNFWVIFYDSLIIFNDAFLKWPIRNQKLENSNFWFL